MKRPHCSVEGCTNTPSRSGLCWGHKKRLQRGTATLKVALGERSDGKGPKARWARLEAAIVRYIEAGRSQKARETLRSALKRYISELDPEAHVFRSDLASRRIRFRKGAR